MRVAEPSGPVSGGRERRGWGPLKRQGMLTGEFHKESIYKIGRPSRNGVSVTRGGLMVRAEALMFLT